MLGKPWNWRLQSPFSKDDEIDQVLDWIMRWISCAQPRQLNPPTDVLLLRFCLQMGHSNMKAPE